MTIPEAVALIRQGVPSTLEACQWADLGCGSGLFTTALASLLTNGSHIYAIDKNKQSLLKLAGKVTIEFIQLDMEEVPFPFPSVDGMILANSFHYTKDKDAFLSKIKSSLKADGTIIFVEYDTEKANQWVPYPIPFNKLKDLLLRHGFTAAKKLGERDSAYGPVKMYACSCQLKHEAS